MPPEILPAVGQAGWGGVLNTALGNLDDRTAAAEAVIADLNATYLKQAPGGASEGVFTEAQGDGGITSILPPLAVNAPGQRIRMPHPDPAIGGNLIITPYASGMGISYDGLGTGGVIQFSASQVAVNGDNSDLPGGHGTAGQFAVSDEYDTGGLLLMSHRYHATAWQHESYADIYNEWWDSTHHGSLHLRVVDSPRTVTDGGTTNGTTELSSATAAFTGADLGRRVQGAGIPVGAYIANINSASDVSLSVAATATASGVTITIGRETVDVWIGSSTAVGSQARQLAFGRIGPSAESGITFGAAEDALLYRSASGALKTNATLSVGGGAGTGLGLTGQRITKSGDVSGPLQIQDGSANGIQFLSAAGAAVASMDNTGAFTIGGAAGTGVILKGQRLTKSGDVGGPLQLQDGSANGIQLINAAGSTVILNVDNSGNTKIVGNVGFYNTTPVAKPTVSGSRAGNAALASLLTALASQGLLTDSSSA